MVFSKAFTSFLEWDISNLTRKRFRTADSTPSNKEEKTPKDSVGVGRDILLMKLCWKRNIQEMEESYASGLSDLRIVFKDWKYNSLIWEIPNLKTNQKLISAIKWKSLSRNVLKFTILQSIVILFFYFHSEKEKNLYAHLCKSYCMDHIHIPG